MDEKFKKIVKKFGELRVFNEITLSVIPEQKIIRPTYEEIKVAADGSKGL